jgi:hypothetical protein
MRKLRIRTLAFIGDSEPVPMVKGIAKLATIKRAKPKFGWRIRIIEAALKTISKTSGRIIRRGKWFPIANRGPR